MLHLLAESAEMRGEEEIGVNAGDVADRAALERARDAADAGDITAVLNHRVNPSRRLRARDQVARFVECLGHRLFAEHVAAPGEARRDDLMARRRHDHVEQQVGTGLVDKRMNVVGDDDVVQTEFRGPVFRARRIEIRQANDAQIGNFRRRLEPGSTHRAAADESGFELHRRPSRGSASRAD